MDAAISGRAGTALLLDGGSLLSFDVDDPATLVSRRPSDLPFLFGGADDLKVLEDIDRPTVAEALEREHNYACALDLALIILDSDLSDAVREEAAMALEELLADGDVLEQVENTLYASPLPPVADRDGAARCAVKAGAATVVEMLQALEERDALIRQVHEAWEMIPDASFGRAGARAEFQQVLIREGLAKRLVVALAVADVGGFQVASLLNPRLKTMQNHREVLQAWTAPFRGATINSPVKVEVREEDWPDQRKKGRKVKREGLDRGAAFKNVESQKALIVKSMERRDFDLAKQIVGELEVYQLRHGGPSFLVKSLCDLAMEAKSLGIRAFQLWLMERAVAIQGDDPWTLAQYADALLQAGRAAPALEAYKRSEEYGGGVVARNGRAAALGELGRLGEALEAYEATIEQHPEDAFARNGRAETLRKSGRLGEALETYEATIEQHPEDVVARNGRAETLRELGRLGEALEAYEATIEQHPEDVVTRSGRAETLRKLGRLGEALEAYEATIEQHPESVVARTGRAETLRELGRLGEALEAYEATIERRPENVVARSGRAETLRELGRLGEALEAYEATIEQHPESVVARNGRGETLRKLGRLGEALEAYEATIERRPEDVVARSGRAETLRELGRLREALEAYDATIEQHPESVVARSGRAETLVELGRLGEALDVYQALVREHPHDAVVRNGCGSVLVRLRRYREALAYLLEPDLLTYQDWIGYHIRGMALLRMGSVPEAIRVFEEGALSNPWQRSREYFVAALGMTWLRQSQFERANEVLERVRDRSLRPWANVLRLHSFGEMGERQRAIEIYDGLSAIPVLASCELTEELRRRYILEEAPLHDDEWVNDQEVDLLLLAINQEGLAYAS
jgi:tetratricopeptide (TPR) repeat protein